MQPIDTIAVRRQNTPLGGVIMPLDKDYLTVSQAADVLECDVSTIRRHVGKSLPAEKVGNSWLIKRSDLDLWAATHELKRGRPKRTT